MGVEQKKYYENALNIVAGVVGLWAISNFAFSKKSRKVVGKSQDWTCEETGKKYADGWVIHISHMDHDKSKPGYDDPEGGMCHSVEAHLDYHETFKDQPELIGLKKCQNDFAIRQLKNTEPRTKWWRKNSG